MSNTVEELFPSPKPSPSPFLSESSSSSFETWSPCSSQTEHLKNVPKNKNVVPTNRNPNKGNDEEGSSFNILNYESWVCLHVLKHRSVFTSNKDIVDLRKKIKLTHDSTEDEIVCFPCSKEERVCWQHKDENEPEFIYMYKLLFEKLSISLPFSKFQCDVLGAINVAPTQLHPNTWGFISSFEILCSCVGVEPSAKKFLYFFKVKVFGKMGWISASGRPGRRLFTAFGSSYKDWKNTFFRVYSSFFFDEGRNPRFPLHWTTDPVPYTTFEIDQLDEVERDEVQRLSCLPMFHCADLIRLNVNRDALMNHFLDMTKKLRKKDLEKYLPSTDSIADTSAPKSTMAAPSGSQLWEKMRKRLAKVPAEPLPHKQARVTKSSVPLDSAGGIQRSVATATAGNVPSSEVPLVDPAPTMVDVPFCPGMIDDGVWSSSEIGGTHLAKLRNEDKVAAARVLQQRALTLMKEVEQDLISDGVDKVIKENAEDKLINNLKRKLEVAHKAQDKLKKELFDLKTNQEKWHIEKINLESDLKEERDLHKSTHDLLKSTQVNLTEEKKKLEQVLSDKVLQYFEGFNCAKSQAAFLCSVDEGKLDAMRLWGKVRDGEIVVDDEEEESKGNDS